MRIVFPEFCCLDQNTVLNLRIQHINRSRNRVNAIIGNNAEALGQGVGNGSEMLVLQRPDIGGQRVRAAARVGNVKDVFQPCAATGFVDQGDAVAAAAYIAVHPGIPGIVIGAGRRAGPLGEDQELLLKGVLVEPGRRAEEGRPVVLVPCNSSCGVLRHLDEIIKFFVGHGSLLSKK